jgi:hypothetical protein
MGVHSRGLIYVDKKQADAYVATIRAKHALKGEEKANNLSETAPETAMKDLLLCAEIINKKVTAVLSILIEIARELGVKYA